MGVGRRAVPPRLHGSRSQQGIELHVVEMPQRGGQIGRQDIALRSVARGRRLRAGSVLPGLVRESAAPETGGTPEPEKEKVRAPRGIEMEI